MKQNFFGGFIELNKEKRTKKPFYKKWWVWVIAIIIVFSLANGGEDEGASKESSDANNQTEKVDDVATETKAKEEVETKAKEEAETKAKEEAENTLSLSQENAIQKGQDYLEYSSFSKSGLAEQLKYDGFTSEEATYGVSKTGL